MFPRHSPGSWPPISHESLGWACKGLTTAGGGADDLQQVNTGDLALPAVSGRDSKDRSVSDTCWLLMFSP